MAFDLDLITLVRAFYLASATAILLVRLVPALSDRFLDYGARQDEQTAIAAQQSHSERALNYLATLKISHSKFSHFYSLSSGCSVFWLTQLRKGGALDQISRLVSETNADESSSIAKVGLCIVLLLLQALRRQQECISQRIKQPSSSMMWVGHYAIGIAFYFVTNIAIVIEHVHLISLDSFSGRVMKMERHLSIVDTVALVVFVGASIKQHEYHSHLASLIKYTLPSQGAFRYVVAPHYTAECAIYLALAILSAPAGKHVNVTMVCALVFVAVNLGVTAGGTKRWMLNKFPGDQEDIRKRWRMIPGLF